ncbi:serine-rich adhesin for platelets-like [Bactrocera tryoni]|uniref:serine-rich adhesin for platelets-like n=1 Tax=Bactrocera tryoni TaxID=59916 RepID=UPI001A98C139|nr:serine-rich adhesin for platelets-like [Bactrocera tryoni]
MAENSRNSKLSLKDDECTFTWKLFTGWDFMIGHAETAHNRIASVVVGFKEVLLEEAEKKKDNRNSEQLARNGNLLSRNAVNITITLLAFFMPMIFDALGLFENWHPRQQLRLQLARIMILNMLNLYSLMFSFIYNIDSKEGPLQTLKERYDNSTYAMNNLTIVMDGYKSNNTNSTAIAIALAHLNLSTTNLVTTTTAATTTLYGLVTRLRCRNITMKCSKPTRINNRNFTTATTLLLLNLSTSTLLPHITTNTESDTTNMWTTLPTTMPPVTTDIDTKTITPQQQEEWSTAQFNAITAAATTITATFSTPATDASSTTITDYTESSTTQTETTDASTLPQSTSTTTTAPGSDSFFDYMDYFVGMPLELSDSQEVASATETTLSGTSGTTENVRRARNGKNLRALQRKPRQALLSALYEATQRAPPGRYSRQLNERRRQSDRDNEPYTDSGAATTTAYTVEESTPGAQQQQLQVESASPAPQNESLPTLHVNTKLLGEVLAYFTSSTSTVEPTTTKLPPTTTTVVTTTTTTTTSTPPTTTTESDGSTTAFFLAEDDIIDESATVNYDTNEFDEDNFETCVRTICDTYPEEEVTITDLDATATPTTPSLTPMEIFEKKMFEVKLDIQQVQRNLTSMCWETSLGQELAKVIVSDGLLHSFSLVRSLYYLVSLSGRALREEPIKISRTQLQKEREEERKKIFKVQKAKPTENSAAALTSRWRKVLEASSPVTPTPPPDFESEEYKTKKPERKSNNSGNNARHSAKKKKSNFVIIDEKTPTSSEKNGHQPSIVPFSGTRRYFQIRRQKPDPVKKLQPKAEVAFKFDETSLEEPQIMVKLGEVRRKKIGTLFALVRDTVNTKWNDDEQSPSSSGGPTTPKFPVTPETAKNINDEAIAIEIPSTPEAEIAAKQHFPTTIPEITIEPKVAAPCYPTTTSDINMSDSEALDKPGPIYQPPLQRRKPIERAQATRQDSQTSVWSDNIPTITISTTGSDECIPKVDPEKKFTTPIIPIAAVAPLKESVVMTVTKSAPPSPDPKVKVIKIDIEDK